MKFIHISDLHIGKRVNNFSMIEDQKHILNQIAEIIEKEDPNAVFIAGDVYDKSVPSAEAVSVFDRFLTRLKEGSPDIFIISGNHDSGERLAFAGNIMENEGIYISGVFDGSVKHKVYENGRRLVVHSLPFVRPAEVRQYYPEAEIRDYNDAVRTVIENMEVDEADINIIICHQFITGGTTSESEEFSVGGMDNVDGTLFDRFDYAALGHLHGPQKIGRDTLRYAGSPLKYSFSEVNQKKSLTVVETGEITNGNEEKPQITVREIPLKPLRDMRIVEGKYDELMDINSRKTGNNEDYLKVVLTDEEEIPYVMDKLRSAYPNIMSLEYKRTKGHTSEEVYRSAAGANLTPVQLFQDFYKRQHNSEISSEKLDYIKTLIEEVWEDEE